MYEQFINQVIEFGYKGEIRRVAVEQVKQTKDGKTMLMGRDAYRNNEHRQFNTAYIAGPPVVIPHGWDRV